MKITDIITEARKNPEQNPKIDPWQQISDRLETVDEIAGVPNLFVSFTALDKLGINPQSTYDTPLGVCSYPAQFVKERGKDSMSRLPFAGTQPFINVFQVSGNIINVNTMTSGSAKDLLKLVKEVYLKKVEETFPAKVDEYNATFNQYVSESIKHAHVKSAGGLFWYVTMMVCKDTELWSSKLSVTWNKLFREIGVDGAIDMGEGIIHINEPTQCVVFNPRVIQNNERLLNKWSRRSRSIGSVHATNATNVKGKTEQELIYLVEKDPTIIAYIPNPSIRVTIAAASKLKSPENVAQYLRKPSLEVLRELINRFSKSTDDMMWYNIKMHGKGKWLTPALEHALETEFGK